jgi:hypothetical protein
LVECVCEGQFHKIRGHRLVVYALSAELALVIQS